MHAGMLTMQKEQRSYLQINYPVRGYTAARCMAVVRAILEGVTVSM